MNKRAVIDSARLLACVGIITGALVSRGAGDDSSPKLPSGTKDAAWIEKRISEWQPTKAERAFEEIGWASGLTEAELLAKKHGRPIFLFTYDGANLTGYRC